MTEEKGILLQKNWTSLIKPTNLVASNDANDVQTSIIEIETNRIMQKLYISLQGYGAAVAASDFFQEVDRPHGPDGPTINTNSGYSEQNVGMERMFNN